MAIVKTAGIFLINNDYKILIGHPTGHKPDFWSIPKGKLDDGETAYEAAVRETWEETNVDLSEVIAYYELESIKYKNGKKKLKPFVIFENENRKINSKEFELKCNSIVDKNSKFNAGKPEMDDFKWVTADEAKELLHPTQVEALKIVKELIEENHVKKSKD